MSWLKWLSDIDERLTIYFVKIINKFILCFKPNSPLTNQAPWDATTLLLAVLGVPGVEQLWNFQWSEFYYTVGMIHNLTDHFTIILTLKLAVCLAILIVIRGCIPRYRYDFLTKIGWVKFLGYVLAFFFAAVLLFLLW